MSHTPIKKEEKKKSLCNTGIALYCITRTFHWYVWVPRTHSVTPDIPAITRNWFVMDSSVAGSGNLMCLGASYLGSNTSHTSTDTWLRNIRVIIQAQLNVANHHVSQNHNELQIRWDCKTSYYPLFADIAWMDEIRLLSHALWLGLFFLVQLNALGASSLKKCDNGVAFR